ncbi:TonB-dependent receptor [Acetobacteraceae bacterium ESL0709]|nr:TonB-dependent receptor [Acetobacteraceae bacterium ESL0697]MDF7677543.1 TonB-dependent receptor [Acetobacteraceae bacterium ESL0709]
MKRSALSVSRFCLLCSACLTALLMPSASFGEDATTQKNEDKPQQDHITVRAGTPARSQITSSGATSYHLSARNIETLPQGENASFNQVMLHMPGVVQDSYGEVHVRGEHGNLTYRINGVLLPESLQGFGQVVDTRIVQSFNLLTGTLPAQYGLHTAGIVDITTKKGTGLNHNEVSLYGGSYNTINPSLQLGGSRGKLDYFVSLSYNHNTLGIENPTNSFRPVHDLTQQGKEFSYLSWHFNPHHSLTLITSVSYGDFHLPATPNLEPAYLPERIETLPYHLNSRFVKDQQNEQNHYAILSYNYKQDDFGLQLSPYFRYGRLAYFSDRERDLIYQGVAQKQINDFTTGGMQADLYWNIAPHHILRAGLLGHYTDETLGTDTSLFATNEDGNLTSSKPHRLIDNSGNWATETSAYVQDEFHINRQLIFTYGVRYDNFASSFRRDDQLGPRASLIWKPSHQVTLHLGYARYFTPPAPQYLSSRSLAHFENTTNAPETSENSAPKVETSHYIDTGLTAALTPHLDLSIDGFSKWAHNLLDTGQFGQAIITTPFNYRHGQVYGGETGLSFHSGPWQFFGNFSYVQTYGQDVSSGQYHFDQEELDYIKNHRIHLDHQGKYTASAGLSWHTKRQLVSLDFLYGNGLRKGFANLGKQSPYDIFNFSYQYNFLKLIPGHKVKVRMDIMNLFDKHYTLHDGSGIGIFQPQYGQRRSAYFSIIGEL